MENIVFLFTSFLSCIIVIGLLFQFMNDRYEKAYDNSMPYKAVWLTAVLLITLVNQLRNPLANVASNSIVYGIVSVVMYKDRNGRKYWRLLEVECFFSICALFEAIGTWGIDYLLQVVGHLPKNEVVQGSIEEIFSKIVLLFFYYVVLQKIWRKELRRNTAQLFFYLIMLIYSMVNFLLLFFDLEAAIPAGGSYGILCVSMGCVTFASLYIFYFMRMTDEKNELDFQVAMMKQQESLQFEYYEIQKEKYRQSIEILHDVSKHIRSIEELYNEGEKEQALQYTKEIDNILKPLIPAEYSNNPMLNILLSDKKQLAESQGIRFRIKIEKAGLEFMPPMDVTTLFGNLLENAIEVCRRCQGKKEICISVCNYNEMLSIRIENTVEWEVKFQNGRPIRESENRSGIGTLNVERCVEKYGGSVLYRCENGRFYCDILLNK